MVIARTRRGHHCLGPVVLAVLVMVSVQQLPSIDVIQARSKPREKLSFDCLGCCGPTCQCTGDCCGDSHIVTSRSESSSGDPDGSISAAAETLSRHKNCQNDGWLLPTARSSFHTCHEAVGTIRLRPAPVHHRQSPDNVHRWSRPGVSQSKPRGPPHQPLTPRSLE